MVWSKVITLSDYITYYCHNGFIELDDHVFHPHLLLIFCDQRDNPIKETKPLYEIVKAAY